MWWGWGGCLGVYATTSGVTVSVSVASIGEVVNVEELVNVRTSIIMQVKMLNGACNDEGTKPDKRSQ
jgi:hypothetical protein